MRRKQLRDFKDIIVLKIRSNSELSLLKPSGLVLGPSYHWPSQLSGEKKLYQLQSMRGRRNGGFEMLVWYTVLRQVLSQIVWGDFKEDLLLW